MKRYVVGFAFNALNEVLLIKKVKPEWQAGNWNGVGGKIETYETTSEAMQREFKEEAGLDLGMDRWRLFCTVMSNDSSWFVYFFCTHLTKYELPTQMEIEELAWHRILPKNVINNLTWLLPMAKAHSMVWAQVRET